MMGATLDSASERISPGQREKLPARKPTGSSNSLRAAAIGLLAALVAIVVVLLASGTSYTLHAYFSNAGGLVTGAQVRVADVTVGSVTGVGLTPSGQADVTMSITDSRITPVHQLTRATIRAVGLAGVTNHYVELSPGPGNGPSLPDGGVLPETQTTGIVSLDQILDTFDPEVRASLQQLIGRSAEIYAGSGSRYLNQMLARLSPALQAVNGVTSQLSSDQADLQTFVSGTAKAATAIASRRPDLISDVSHTARVFAALASQRVALADGLQRAPAMLAQATRTLADAGTAATALRPVLREVPPTASRLGTVLQTLPPALNQFTPVLDQLLAQLPDLRTSLAGFAPLSQPAVSALRTTSTALKASMPILAGLRIYGADFLLGILNGLVGVSTAPYDSSGHYIHVQFTQPYQQFINGIGLGTLGGSLAPGIINLREHILARCPGGALPPAPDGSNPWIPNKSLCNPADDSPPSVNQP
jgi:phospholipid/cholesterol/gamma-HCH transport system substrate-binding protein